MANSTAAPRRPATRRPRAAAGLHPQPRNPYRVPRPAVISFSGGRTSSYMLKSIVDAYDGRLPREVAVVFANTGMERPETLEFVDVCGREWGVDIVWVLWRALHKTHNGDWTPMISRSLSVPCALGIGTERLTITMRPWPCSISPTIGPTLP